MKYTHLLLVFLLVSCGGGGGGGGSAAPAPVAFVLTLASGIFSTNEDTDLNGSIAATANESVTLTYAITSDVSSGVLTLSAAVQLSTYRIVTFLEPMNFNIQLMYLKKI